MKTKFLKLVSMVTIILLTMTAFSFKEIAAAETTADYKVNLSDLTQMATGLLSQKVSLDIPEDATKVTGYLFDSLSRMIPLAEAGNMNIN